MVQTSYNFNTNNVSMQKQHAYHAQILQFTCKTMYVSAGAVKLCYS